MAQVGVAKYFEIIHFGWVSWLFTLPTTTNLCFCLKQRNTITLRLCWGGRERSGCLPTLQFRIAITKCLRFHPSLCSRSHDNAAMGCEVVASQGSAQNPSADFQTLCTSFISSLRAFAKLDLKQI